MAILLGSHTGHSQPASRGEKAKLFKEWMVHILHYLLGFTCDPSAVDMMQLRPLHANHFACHSDQLSQLNLVGRRECTKPRHKTKCEH